MAPFKMQGDGIHLSDLDTAEVDSTRYQTVFQTFGEDMGDTPDDWYRFYLDPRTKLVDVAQLSPAQQKAFYINLYNAGMLQAVLERYPIKSVKSIGLIPFSIFKKDYTQQGERSLSLDDIEKGILLQKFPDPRIHFAVNCASVSCPPLRAEPYRGAQLEAQLEEQTRLFAASDQAARGDASKRRTAYSELFKWYASDFGVSQPALFLNRYRSQPLPTEYDVIWIDYDWSLNQSK
ncbi:MAG TPA: DUF547 domain-containing protein [Opitutae bacterium]|nr:hypothetical protein [Puniceicoccaceae bacterium]HBR93696.1 DUF547 domain-containing protein [Opitutae bacterium]|tara:strand:+ start:1099 stop:1800 length:702 start_codon:yes stop_codon:yes gene_type:complete